MKVIKVTEVNASDAYNVSNYPGPGAYVNNFDGCLYVVSNNTVGYVAANALSLTEEIPEHVQAPQLVGISEETLLKVIAIVQKPELAEALTGGGK